MESTKRSPDFKFHRIVAAAESGPFSLKNGINFGTYKKGLIQVVPVDVAALAGDVDVAALTLGTSNPSVELYSWSENLGQFIKHNPASVVAGAGAGVPYEFTVDAYGQTIYVAVTSGITGGQGVVLLSAGFEAIEASS